MDARRALLTGGGFTAVASIAVVCAFTVSGSVALADVTGRPLAVAPVVVPARTPTAEPSAQSSVEPIAVPSPTTSASHVPQIVPAPEPRDVAATGEPIAAEPAPTAKPKPSASAPAQRGGYDEVIAQFKKDGDWKKVVAWARANGWSADEVKRWIRAFREQRQTHDSFDGSGWTGSHRSDDSVEKTPAQAGDKSDRDSPRSHVGSKRDRSRHSPDQRD